MLTQAIYKTMKGMEEKKMSMEEIAEENAIAAIEAMFGAAESTKQINEKEMEVLERAESLDARLKTCIQEELEGFSIGLQLIEKSKENASEIDKLSIEIADICQACDDLFQNYALVKEITTIKRNLKEVIETVKYLKCLKDKVKDVEEFLKNEQNLLKVHSIVRTYEMLRLAIERQIRRFNLTYAADMDPYFQQINQLRQMLTQCIDDVFETMTECANKTPEILVKIAVITERDRRDKELIRQQAKAENSQIQQYEYDGVDYVKNIQRLVTQAAEESIRKKFQLGPDPCVDTANTMKNLQDYLDEVTVVAFDASPCFPPEYHIRDVYLNASTNKLNELFDGWKSEKNLENITNPTIISVLKWVNDDFIPTMDRIGVSHDQVPDFLVTLRPIQACYRERVRGKMFEWVTNIVKEDCKQTPVTINNLLYTTAPVDLFSIVKEQIEIAKTSKSSEFIFEVVNALVTPLEQYSHLVVAQLKDSLQYNQLSEEEQENAEDKSVPLGYVISIINNCNSCIEKMEATVDMVSDMVGPEIAQKFDFSTVIGSFDHLIDEACMYLKLTVLNDCKETVSQLFDDDYYGMEDYVEMIAGCIQDYASTDFQPNLLKLYVEDIVKGIVTELVNMYITQLVTKKHKFYNNDERKTGDKIAHDADTIRSFLENYMDPTKLSQLLNVFRGFSQLLKEEPESVRSGYGIILQDYKDCPIETIKFLIGERDDFSGSQKDTAVEACMNAWEQANIDIERVKPTIFSRIQPPSKLAFMKQK